MAHQGEHEVIVASPEATVLDRLLGVSPDVVLFQSVHDRRTLAGLVAGAMSCGAVDGVTVRHDLLNAASVGRLRSAVFVVFAWTVNERARAEELIRLGVDGIITGSTALLGFLGASQLGELGVRDDAGAADSRLSNSA